jgi:hypothetical protein
VSGLTCRWCGQTRLTVAHPMFGAFPSLDDWHVCVHCFEVLAALEDLLPYVRVREREIGRRDADLPREPR